MHQFIKNVLIFKKKLKIIFHKYIYSYTALNSLDKKLLDYIDYDCGYFIEIGANDGISQSNTFFFERKKKWSGVLIESNKKKFLESMSKMSQSSLLVSLCDKLHSTNCMINDYNKIGKKIWTNHSLTAEETKWYYKNLCKNFKKFIKNNKSLKDKFQRNTNEIEFLINK